MNRESQPKKKPAPRPSAELRSLDDISNAQRRMVDLAEQCGYDIVSALRDGDVRYAANRAGVAYEALRNFEKVNSALRVIREACHKYS